MLLTTELFQIDKGLQYYASAARPWRVPLLPE